VYGLSGEDGNLTEAPGKWTGCNKSCHDSLATDISWKDKDLGTIRGGCEGCHGGFHNQDDSAWVRHPSDAYLPGGTTEYAAYTTYSTEALVARNPP